MAGALTKLKIDEPNRAHAKQGADFLERAAMQKQAGLFLVEAGGNRLFVELPPQVLNALRAVLTGMADHDEALLIDAGAELSPEEAAKILGVSRPIVYQRMDSGRLPYRQIGAHRRLHLDDVLKLRDFEERRRTFAAALASDTDELESERAPVSLMPMSSFLRMLSQRQALGNFVERLRAFAPPK
jgi:excisionase family DNA binding protein